jgi:hypothetical protein
MRGSRNSNEHASVSTPEIDSSPDTEAIISHGVNCAAINDPVLRTAGPLMCRVSRVCRAIRRYRQTRC